MTVGRLLDWETLVLVLPLTYFVTLSKSLHCAAISPASLFLYLVYFDEHLFVGGACLSLCICKAPSTIGSCCVYLDHRLVGVGTILLWDCVWLNIMVLISCWGALGPTIISINENTEQRTTFAEVEYYLLAQPHGRRNSNGRAQSCKASRGMLCLFVQKFCQRDLAECLQSGAKQFT